MPQGLYPYVSHRVVSKPQSYKWLMVIITVNGIQHDFWDSNQEIGVGNGLMIHPLVTIKLLRKLPVNSSQWYIHTDGQAKGAYSIIPTLHLSSPKSIPLQSDNQQPDRNHHIAL